MKKLFLTVVILILVALNADAQVLKLQDFLNQVQQGNETVKGALYSSQGAIERSGESKLIFSPSFFANGFAMNDKRESLFETFTGDDIKVGGTEFGFSQATRFGMVARVSYGIYDTHMYNADPAFIPQSEFTYTGLTLEVSQPLWQNGGGRQYRNMERAGEAQAKASSYAKLYEAQLIMLDAEIKYWKLAGIRESIKIISTSLDETKSILTFNKAQQRRGLIEISDVLQSEAEVKARNLDLISALSEEKEAMQELNTVRKIDSETVEESLAFPDTDDVLTALSKPFPHVHTRNDVKAAEEGAAALTAANEISKEKTIPDLSLFAVTSLNSMKDDTSDAIGNTFNSDHPYYQVGVKMSVPLDAHLNSLIKGGYTKENKGTEMELEQKKYNQDKEWQILMNKIADIKERLIATRELEQAQLVKLKKERERQKQGQSTMFQVFMFEQEYLASQLNLVNIKGTALALIAQAKLYEEYNENIGGAK